MRIEVQNERQRVALVNFISDLTGGVLDALTEDKTSPLYQRGTDVHIITNAFEEAPVVILAGVPSPRFLVSTEDEERLMAPCLRALKDGGAKNFDEWCDMTQEAGFLSEALEYLNQADIEVDPAVIEINLLDDSIIYGTCRFCGVQTEGLGDDCYDLTYSRYLELNSPKVQAAWHCESCRPCYGCGEKVGDEDGLCPDCAAS